MDFKIVQNFLNTSSGVSEYFGTATYRRPYQAQKLSARSFFGHARKDGERSRKIVPVAARLDLVILVLGPRPLSWFAYSVILVGHNYFQAQRPSAHLAFALTAVLCCLLERSQGSQMSTQGLLRRKPLHGGTSTDGAL